MVTEVNTETGFPPNELALKSEYPFTVNELPAGTTESVQILI